MAGKNVARFFLTFHVQSLILPASIMGGLLVLIAPDQGKTLSEFCGAYEKLPTGAACPEGRSFFIFNLLHVTNLGS
jgi:hypothetical protein